MNSHYADAAGGLCRLPVSSRATAAAGAVKILTGRVNVDDLQHEVPTKGLHEVDMAI